MTAPAGSGALTTAELAAVLRTSLLRLNRMIRNQRVDTSVTLTQLSAMATLDQRGPMSAGELASLERVQPPSMTKVLASLVERGLLHRGVHPSDRRQVIMSVTDDGLALLRSERAARDRWLSHQLAALHADEQAMLLDLVPLLDRLAEQ